MSITLSTQTAPAVFTGFVQQILRLTMTPLLVLIVALGGLQLATSTAEAGFGKKVKFAGKVFKKVEKAGSKMARKKGIVGKLGKGLKATGKAGRKGTGFVRKQQKKVGKFVGKKLGKSKAGRGVLKAHKTYKKARKSTINKAFKNCRARVCEDVRDGADALIPG